MDLLWNGGIGTYVKASYETHKDASDPSNDSLRVDASQLRARVVGEGGNLGFTHAARVEFADGGGSINADSLDNSAGVDMSDHEVNLKILCSSLERSGELNREDRDAMLLAIAEDVSDRVQNNNESHSRMVSLDVTRSIEQLDDFRILLNDLEDSGRLDRTRHVLPEDGELLRREQHNEGLVRPELTKLGPFVKMGVYEALLDDERFYTPYVTRWLLDYFPAAVQKRFKGAILQHQLRREIAATMITNTLVDSMGVTHFSRLQRITGRDPVEIAYASLLATDLLNAWDLKTMLHDCKGVRISVVYVKLRHVEQSITMLAEWLLIRGIDVLQADEVIERFGKQFRDYEKALIRIMERGEMVVDGDVEEISSSPDGQTTTLEIEFLEGEEAFFTLIARSDLCGDPTRKGKKHIVAFDGGDEEAAALLQAMIKNGVAVYSFSRKRESLEDVFLQIGAKELS